MIAYRCVAILALGAAAATALLLPSQAAADSWVATKTLANGIPRNCGDAPWSDYAVEIRGVILTGTPTNPGQRDIPVRVNLQTLRPDGSGRVLVTPPTTGIVAQFDFAPGVGPRDIVYGRVNVECRWLLRPK